MRATDEMNSWSASVTRNMIRAKTQRHLRSFVQVTERTKARTPKVSEEEIMSQLMVLAKGAKG